MTDKPIEIDEAAQIWAAAIKETGIWMEPNAEKIAELGRVLMPKIREAIENARTTWG